MKKTVFLAVLAFFALAGCSGGSLSVQTSGTDAAVSTIKPDEANKVVQDKPLLIACVVNQDDQYMKLLQLGMSDAAENAGADVILANTYGKLDKEIELINTYIKSGVDGICIHPVSVDLSVPILQKARDSGIKVISAGIAIDDRYQIGFIESDQWELGKKTGEACSDFIKNNLAGQANIAIINYKQQFLEESTKRTDGFKSEVTKLPGVKIVAEQDAWLVETAVSQARSIISAEPDLNIIWAANEGGTVGSVIAVKNAQKAGKVFVFGTDVSEQLLNMLLNEDNILQAVTGQQPYKIGFQTLERMISDINGAQGDGKIIIPGIPLSRRNENEVRVYMEDFKKMIELK